MKKHCQLGLAPLAVALLWLGATPVRAAGPMGADNGWVVSNSNACLLTAALCAKMAAAGTGWIRIDFRSTPSLDQPGNTLWGPTLVGLYNQAVNNARAAGLTVIGLIGPGVYPGSQTQWEANNSENTSGDGSNAFIQNWVQQAAAPILNIFHDRVKYWEIWNEPNAWTSSPGVGATYIYPSNFAQLMAQVYAYKETSKTLAPYYINLDDLTIFTGGIFGFSRSGVNYPGDDYLTSVYEIELNNPNIPGGVGAWKAFKSQYGVCPLDSIGEHIYVDQGGATTAAHLKYYLDKKHGVLTTSEGTGSKKKTFLTEVGWTTASVSQATQAQNLATLAGLLQSGTVPYVQTAIWFQWQDNPDAALYYGVVDSCGAAKAAYASYEAWETYQGVYQNQSVNTPIQTYYNTLGQSALGNPFDNGGTAWAHSWGASQMQDCDGVLQRRRKSGSGEF